MKAPVCGAVLGSRDVCAVVAALVCAAFCTAPGASAHASPHARADAGPGELAGTHLTIGPIAAATFVEDSWFAATGAELSLVRHAGSDAPLILGIAAGGLGHAVRGGGRLWLEAELGLETPLAFGIGLGAGATVELDRITPPRFGVQATLFVVAGVVPYLRFGHIAETGGFIESGIMLKLPIRLR